jgi:hypothetical protein
MKDSYETQLLDVQEQILAQQIKTNELLRAMLHQFQHVLSPKFRDYLEPKLGVSDTY